MFLEALLAQLLGAPATPPVAPPSSLTCPPGMRAVEGVHNEYVQRLCLDYAQGHCHAFLPGFVAREPRATSIRVCMDELEWPNRAGALPDVMMSWNQAGEQCKSVGKRLCTEFEWEMACEGPETLPFPYGWREDPAACNTAKPYKPVSEAKLASNDERVRDAETKRVWQGDPTGSHPRCTSPYRVVDLVGNVEEWVSTSRPEWPWPSALKGGYWSKPWAGCRGTNEGHGPLFRFYEVGFRCCKNP